MTLCTRLEPWWLFVVHDQRGSITFGAGQLHLASGDVVMNGRAAKSHAGSSSRLSAACSRARRRRSRRLALLFGY